LEAVANGAMKILSPDVVILCWQRRYELSAKLASAQKNPRCWQLPDETSAKTPRLSYPYT
jgi:hypothetical protein